MQSIGISEIVIIFVVVVAIIIITRQKRRPRSPGKATQRDSASGDDVASGPLRRWIITVLVLLTLGLLGYYFFYIYPQP